MPVRFSRWNSNIAAQPITSDIPAATPGNLPTSRQAYIAPPEVVEQGNSFLSQDSIGSAKFETRNFEISTVDPTNSLLTGSAPSVRQVGLSPERPSLVGMYDIFGSSLTTTAGEKSFTKSMNFSEFEANLSLEDYKYLVNELSSGDATAPIISAIEAQAESEIASVQEPLVNIAQLSVAAEKFSTQLDVISHWDTLKNDIESFYRGYIANGFDPGPAISDIGRLDSGSASTRGSTSFIRGLEDNIVNDSQGDIVTSIEGKIREEGLFFNDGTIAGYSLLGRMGKAGICCVILSRIYGTLANSSFTPVPVTFNGNPVFESKRAGGRQSNYDAIVRPALTAGISDPIQQFRTEFVGNFTNAVSSIARSSNIIAGGGRYPIDILQIVLKELVNSFPTLRESDETPQEWNANEISDAVVMNMSRYQRTPWAGLLRGTLLMMILDDRISSLGLESKFLSFAEDESAIPIIGLQTQFSEDLLTESRLENYPLVSRDLVKEITRKEFAEFIDPTLKSEIWSSNSPKTNGVLINDRELRVNGFVDRLPGGYDISSAKAIDGDQALIGSIICKSIDNFARRSGTIASSISKIANAIGSRFVVSINDLKLTDEVGPTKSKRIIYSIIFECVVNLVDLFVGPGYSPVETIQQPAGGAGTDTRVVELLADITRFERAAFEYYQIATSGTFSGYTQAQKQTAGQLYADYQDKIAAAEAELQRIRSNVAAKLYRLSARETFLRGLRLAQQISNAPDGLSIGAIIASERRSEAFRSFEMPGGEGSGLTSVYENTRLKISRVAALNSIGKLADNESLSLITSFDKALTASVSIDARQRRVLFRSLTPEIASQKSLLYDRLVSQGNFTSTAQQSIFDISATKVLKNIFNAGPGELGNLIDNTAIAIIGIPAGFTQNLRLSATEEGASSNRIPLYYTANSYARKLTNPYLDDVKGLSFSFHPYVECSIVGEDLSNVNSTGFGWLVFNVVEGRWNSVSYTELRDRLQTFGLNDGTINSLIIFHRLDALCKSAIRIISGIDLRSLLQDNSGFQISPGRASQLLSLLQSARPGLIPSRGLQANQFLNINSNDGNFAPIPFSRLSDQASSLTTPADHSLLVDFLKSGAFTSSTVSESLFAVSGLERLYCIPLDFDEFTFTFGGATTASANVQDGTLVAFDIGTVY